MHACCAHSHAVGLVQRQEEVSMLPVTLMKTALGAQRRGALALLDLCAAPGSKTAQLLDLVGPTVGIHYRHI